MITQTEIISLAINALDDKIVKWQNKCEGCGGEWRQLLEKMTAESRAKRDELRTLYLIQTGKEYE